MSKRNRKMRHRWRYRGGKFVRCMRRGCDAKYPTFGDYDWKVTANPYRARFVEAGCPVRKKK